MNRRELFAIGVVSLLGQVVLLREVAVALSGSELIVLLGLCAWLVGSAAGAAAGRRVHTVRVRAGLLVGAALLPLLVLLARGARRLCGAIPGAYLPFPQQLLVLAAVMLPLALLAGLLFTWAAREAVRGRRTLAAAYSIESAGAAAGGLLATGLAALGLPNLGGAAVVAASAVIAVWPRRAGALAAVLLAALAFGTAPVDLRSSAWSHAGLVAVADTPYARVAVTRGEGQVAVYVNGALAADSESTSAEEFVMTAALQVAAPRRLLVLGGAAEGLVGEVLAHGPERVDLVEIDGRALALVRPLLTPAAQAALDDPRVRVVTADPRRFLRTAGRDVGGTAGRDAMRGAARGDAAHEAVTRDDAYDLVLVGAPDPDSGLANRLYTEEFFAACARRLAPGGVLAVRLRGAENTLPPLEVARTASIVRALRGPFADVVVLPGATQVLLASASALPRDPEVLAGRYAERGLHARRAGPPYLRYLYTNDRFEELAGRIAGSPASPNRDARPVCYPLTIALWLGRFFPRLALADGFVLAPRGLVTGSAAPVVLLVVAGLALSVTLAVALRRIQLARRALRVGAAACAGMLIQSVVLLLFQAHAGALFQDIGLLLTAFMAGLALGAALLARCRGACRTRTAALLVALCALALVTAGLAWAGWNVGLFSSAGLQVLAGALVAAVFADAAHVRDEAGERAPGDDAERAIAPLYAADLAGGCAGSLVATLLLVPFAGLDGAALVAFGTAALALLFI